MGETLETGPYNHTVLSSPLWTADNLPVTFLFYVNFLGFYEYELHIMKPPRVPIYV
jgi:hypothetical protein